MLKARIDSAASAFTALSPLVRNLPPPDIRLIVPKGCSTVHRRIVIRLSFATNDERTAKRVSDALGTATEMRAMKNYAGHRLSPWLGHLMVSRQETARPLLTPGEVMQLPPSDEIVMVAGTPPIRAKKARYFEDPRFAERLLSAPDPRKTAPRTRDDPWAGRVVRPAPAPADPRGVDEDKADGGIRRQPELPEHEDIVPRKEELAPTQEFELMDDDADEPARQSRMFRQQGRQLARQASLDRDDGIEL
jgi:type IV secretion system protein VirD4